MAANIQVNQVNVEARQPARVNLLQAAKVCFRFLPRWAPTLIYTVLLRPPFLRRRVNALLLQMIPKNVQVEGVTIALNPKDPIFFAALTTGVFETSETRFLRDKIKPGMRVLDIGANIGYYTALFSQWVGSEGLVTSFEPEPGNFHFLSETIAANQFTQTRAVNAAVGRAPGDALLFLSEYNQGDHRVYQSTDAEHTAKDRTVSVPMVSIDTLISEQETVDFIKMDVQGAEWMVLAGMRETIRRNPNVMLLTEFWPQGLRGAGGDPANFLRILQEDLKLTIWEVGEEAGALTPVENAADLIRRHPGRKYVNLFCTRARAAAGGSAEEVSELRKAA